MSFGPRKILFQDIIISSLGALMAGFIGSLLILIITFFSSKLGIVNVSGSFHSYSTGVTQTSSMFPLILSLITFLGTSITLFLTYKFLHLTSPERYKKSIIIFGQIALFSVISYIFFTPMYIYLGLKSYDNIMYIFIVHTLIVTFGTSIILEMMNNYRHILIGLYGSFIGLFLASGFAILIFFSFSSGTAKLISLIILLPIINFCVTFFKQIFELLYYQYYLVYNQDQLGDIFYQIKIDEDEDMRLQEEKNLI